MSDEALDIEAVEKEWRRDLLDEDYWKLTQVKTDRMAEIIGILIAEVKRLRARNRELNMDNISLLGHIQGD
jgi:hypothetical protein